MARPSGDVDGTITGAKGLDETRLELSRASEQSDAYQLAEQSNNK
jgi:hypothetical protein